MEIPKGKLNNWRELLRKGDMTDIHRVTGLAYSTVHKTIKTGNASRSTIKLIDDYIRRNKTKRAKQLQAEQDAD